MVNNSKEENTSCEGCISLNPSGKKWLCWKFRLISKDDKIPKPYKNCKKEFVDGNKH